MAGHFEDWHEEFTVLPLHKFWVSQPTPSLNGEDDDVVYLMASPKCFLPKAWALALHMRNTVLLDVAEFGTETGVTYLPSTISNYMSLPANFVML
uniref:DUF1618 domain-containing protein n=1 Tax=Oryza brachyantha TaxID=4533 RepID=J3N7N5_ORYBR